MLSQSNPQLGRMLDEQERQKALQQQLAPTNYGNSGMGMFLTAASGAQKSLGAGASNLVNQVNGKQAPMGMYEQTAIQNKDKAERERVQSLQGNTAAVSAYINGKVNTGALTKEEAAGYIQLIANDRDNKINPLDIMKEINNYIKDKASAGSKNKGMESESLVDADTGEGYIAFLDNNTQKTIYTKNGKVVNVEGKNLVTPNVFGNMESSRRKITEREAEAQQEGQANIVEGLDDKYKRQYYQKLQAIPSDAPEEEKNLLRMDAAIKVSSEQKAAQAIADQQDYTDTMDFIGEEFNRIKDLRKDMSAVRYGLTSNIWGTDALSVRTSVSTLQANIFIEKLKQMKQAAANGSSGMGQVTEREIQFLIDSLGALNPAEDNDIFSAKMDNVLERYAKIAAKMPSGTISREKQKEEVDKITGKGGADANLTNIANGMFNQARKNPKYSNMSDEELRVKINEKVGI